MQNTKLSLDYAPTPEISAYLIGPENLYPMVKQIIDQARQKIVPVILFGGDRLRCCDEAIALYNQEDLASLATISPTGESFDGHPAIVGLYTLPSFRQKGFGKTTLRRTIERCLERGFNKVDIDSLSAYTKKSFDQLPEHLQATVNFRDAGLSLDQLSKND